jgi:hypothetical protein
MRPRRIMKAAVLATTVAGLAACGGDATKAVGEVSAGTYVNGSNQTEYCDLVANADAQLVPDLAGADPDSVLPAINTVGDIETLAPEESKGDWASMRALLQVVVDVNGDTSGDGGDALEAAGSAFEEVSTRVAGDLAERCGVTLD